MAGSVLLHATGLTDITLPSTNYQLGRGYGPQGATFDVSWARSPFFHPVPTNAQQTEGNYFLPVRILGSTDANYQTRQEALLEMVTQTVWTLTFTRGSWTEVYLCSASSWQYDSGLPGFADLRLPAHVQKVAITVPCVRTS